MSTERPSHLVAHQVSPHRSSKIDHAGTKRTAARSFTIPIRPILKHCLCVLTWPDPVTKSRP